jgi:hypothetical protein
MAPPNHTGVNLQGPLARLPATDPRNKEPILWCTAECQEPTPHVYMGTVPGKASTTFQVFTCRGCFGRRVFGCF